MNRCCQYAATVDAQNSHLSVTAARAAGCQGATAPTQTTAVIWKQQLLVIAGAASSCPGRFFDAQVPVLVQKVLSKFHIG